MWVKLDQWAENKMFPVRNLDLIHRFLSSATIFPMHCVKFALCKIDAVNAQPKMYNSLLKECRMKCANDAEICELNYCIICFLRAFHSVCIFCSIVWSVFFLFSMWKRERIAMLCIVQFSEAFLWENSQFSHTIINAVTSSKLIETLQLLWKSFEVRNLLFVQINREERKKTPI